MTTTNNSGSTTRKSLPSNTIDSTQFFFYFIPIIDGKMVHIVVIAQPMKQYIEKVNVNNVQESERKRKKIA